MRLTIAYTFFLLLLAFSGHAQQQAMFTQYMFNGLALNPAYAGSHGSISASAIARIQWVGIDGAPRTQTFSAHSPIPGRNMAVGLVVSHDQLGVSSNNMLFGSYAYRIEMEKSTLSMGMQVGISNMEVDYGSLGLDDPNLQASIRGTKPNVGMGLYYYSDEFFVGFSMPVMFSTELAGTINDVNGVYDIRTEQLSHMFMTAGYLFYLSPLMKLKPSFLMKSVAGAPIEFDINANLILDDKVWVGLSYRSMDSMDFLLEFQVNPQFRFGYAYDYSLSDLNRVNSGSHEFMINYRFVIEKTKVVTPRYF